MTSLGVVQLDPVLVRQNTRVKIATQVWIPKVVKLRVFAERFPVLSSEFLFEVGLVPSEGLFPSGHALKHPKVVVNT